MVEVTHIISNKVCIYQKSFVKLTFLEWETHFRVHYQVMRGSRQCLTIRSNPHFFPQSGFPRNHFWALRVRPEFTNQRPISVWYYKQILFFGLMTLRLSTGPHLHTFHPSYSQMRMVSQILNLILPSQKPTSNNGQHSASVCATSSPQSK